MPTEETWSRICHNFKDLQELHDSILKKCLQGRKNFLISQTKWQWLEEKLDPIYLWMTLWRFLKLPHLVMLKMTQSLARLNSCRTDTLYYCERLSIRSHSNFDKTWHINYYILWNNNIPLLFCIGNADEVLKKVSTTFCRTDVLHCCNRILKNMKLGLVTEFQSENVTLKMWCYKKCDLKMRGYNYQLNIWELS